MAMVDPSPWTAPLYDRITYLQGVLDRSPCYLVVKRSDEVMEHVGQGDRIMALEVTRLRNALTMIADGTIADKDVPAFAWAALDP